MSRNKRRLNIPQQKNIQPTTKEPQIPPQPFQESNPFGLSFVVPTEMVKLPSKGNFYEEGNPLRGVTEIEVKSMTAAEEDILINDSYVQQGTVFDRLIDSIVMTAGVTSQDMMDCDKIAVLMSARKTGYGDLVTFDVACGNCSTQYPMEVSLTQMMEDSLGDSSENIDNQDWQVDESTNTYSFKLPVTGLDINIRILTPSDLKALEASQDQKQRLNLPFNETLEFLRLAIVSAQGIDDRTSINKLVEILPAADARKIRLVHNLNLPKVSSVKVTTCPNCGNTEEKEVPFSLGWFWSK